MKLKIERKINELKKLIENREEIEKINCIIANDFEKSIKIYYTINKEYAKEHNLDFLNRVLEYNPKIQNLSHTREYACNK